MKTQITAKQRQLNREIAEFTERISQQAQPHAEPDAVKYRWQQITQSLTAPLEGGLGGVTEYFGQTYTPHYFTSPSANFHADLDYITSTSNRHLWAIHGPREHAKSVRARIGLMRRILTGSVTYPIIISEQLHLAREHIEYIHTDLLTNPRISSDFNIDILRKDDNKGVLLLKITPEATGVTHFVRLQAGSYGTAIKGKVFMQHRPDFCLIDDFENTKTARNHAISRQKRDWVFQEVFPAMSDKAPIIWLGNMGAESSALYYTFLKIFQDDNDALRSFLSTGTTAGQLNGCKTDTLASNGELDGNCTPVNDADDLSIAATALSYRADRTDVLSGASYLWPERYDPDWYRTMQATLGNHIYQSEMNGYPIKEGSFFKNEWFKRYDELPPDEKLRYFSWCDPAFGKSKSACFKTVVVVATDGALYYVVDAWARQTETVSDMIDAWFVFFDTIPGLLHGQYENNFGQDDRLARDLEDAAERNGRPLPASGDSNTGNKAARIESLQAIMSTGRLLWPEKPSKDVTTIINQFLGYPDDYDDGPDAIESAISRSRFNSGPVKYQSLKKRRYARRLRS